jgi:hypothetical protein
MPRDEPMEESCDFTVDSLELEEPVLTVVAHFRRLGLGARKQSDFDVHTEWKDVKAIIDKFCEAKHPEALALRRAQAVATAMQALAWRSPDSD